MLFTWDSKLSVGGILLLLASVCESAATPLSYQEIILKHHNVHRANHSSPALTWGPTMAANAETWAKACSFSHNTAIGGQSYGQNLMAGVRKPDIAVAVSDWWYNGEFNNFKYYGKDNPDFSNFGGYGHFSQVVWSGTKTVGCFTQDCSAKGLSNVGSNVPPYLTVCNYWPPGNFGGEWAGNVKKPKGKPIVTSKWNYNPV